MSVACQGSFCHSLSRCLGLWTNRDGYLERGRLPPSWFLARDLRDFLKESTKCKSLGPGLTQKEQAPAL